jgi:hypothetical protein
VHIKQWNAKEILLIFATLSSSSLNKLTRICSHTMEACTTLSQEIWSLSSLKSFTRSWCMTLMSFSCTFSAACRMRRHLPPVSLMGVSWPSPCNKLCRTMKTLILQLSTNSLVVRIVNIISIFIVNVIGIMRTIVTCGNCQNKSITYNPYMALSLTIESSLDKCLMHYLKED